MKKLFGILILNFVLISSYNAAIADEKKQNSIPGTFTGNVGMFSEYVFRGISQSDEAPAIQGTIEWNHDKGYYLGIWGTNVDFNDNSNASTEFDVYGGYRGVLSQIHKKISYDLGFVYYAYPGATSKLNYDYLEAQAALNFEFRRKIKATTSINYSNNFFADSGHAWYPKVSVTIPFRFKIMGDAYFARQYVDDNTKFGLPDYNTWGVGLGYNLKGFDLKLQYIDTNISDAKCPSGWCDERAVFSVIKPF